jgi:lipopolysaccharide heptosyltransferase I
VEILIVRLGAIGDIVHTLPALAAIKRAMPDAHVSWAVERRSAEILRENTLIDRLIELDTRSIRGLPTEEKLSSMRRQIKELKSRNFDVAIDFQGLLKSAVVARASGAKKRVGFSRRALREPASRIFLTDTVRTDPGSHVIRKNLALAGGALAFDAAAFPLEFPIATDQAAHDEAASIAEKAGRDFVVLNPGGGWATKLWPAENYGRLADLIRERLGLASVVTVGPGEEKLGERAAAAAQSDGLVLARPSLKGFYELARRSRLYIGGDTGPTHIAAAAGTPIVGLFGPTEWWRNGSLDPRDICVERIDIGCRVDCHRRTCGNWICMQISPETVCGAIEARLSILASKSSVMPSN